MPCICDDAAPCRILPCSCGMADALEAGDDDYDAASGYHEHLLQRRRIRSMRAAVEKARGLFFYFDALSNMAADITTPS